MIEYVPLEEYTRNSILKGKLGTEKTPNWGRLKFHYKPVGILKFYTISMVSFLKINKIFKSHQQCKFWNMSYFYFYKVSIIQNYRTLYLNKTDLGTFLNKRPMSALSDVPFPVLCLTDNTMKLLNIRISFPLTVTSGYSANRSSWAFTDPFSSMAPAEDLCLEVTE